MLLAVHVSGQVLRRPAQLEQHLLQVAPLAGVHEDALGVEPLTDEGCHLLAAQHLFEHGDVDGLEHQAVLGVLHQLQPTVPGHRLGHVDQQRMRHRVARVLQQHVDHLLGVVPGSPRVPQPQRGQPVGVHVLGSSLQFGERCDRPSARGGLIVVDLQQQRLVALDDQWSVTHSVHPFHRFTFRRGQGLGQVDVDWARVQDTSITTVECHSGEQDVKHQIACQKCPRPA